MKSSRILRVAGADDAPEIREIYRPFIESSHTSFELRVPDISEISARVADTLEKYPWLVVEEAGRVLGYAYAGSHRARPAYQWCTEVSVYVGDGARRGGIARTLYRGLFALLRHQGFVNAYAGIALPNEASVLFHQSFGFKKIGIYEKVGFKNGAWHDVGWWQLFLRTPDTPCGPPHFFKKLDSGEVRDILDGACNPDSPST
jgi:phosphinothricin acetyltransferase